MDKGKQNKKKKKEREEKKKLLPPEEVPPASAVVSKGTQTPNRSPDGNEGNSEYPGGGKTFLGSFQRVRIEGRRGRSYWEWKSSEMKSKAALDSNSSKKVSFPSPVEGDEQACQSRHIPGGVRVLPPYVVHDSKSSKEGVARIRVSFDKEPLERSSPSPPPTGSAPSAPAKELLYADAETRRAARDLAVGQEHQLLSSSGLLKYSREKQVTKDPPNKDQGFKAVGNHRGKVPELRPPPVGRSDDRNIPTKDNKVSTSTYTGYSESSINTSLSPNDKDNTLSSIPSISSYNREYEVSSKQQVPIDVKHIDVKPKSVPQPSSRNLHKGRPAESVPPKASTSGADRPSGALVWVSQPGGGARLEWVPTGRLSTLRAVPASPQINLTERIISHPQKISEGRKGVTSRDVDPKGEDDEGGGVKEDGGMGRNDVEDARNVVARASDDPRAVSEGNAKERSSADCCGGASSGCFGGGNCPPDELIEFDEEAPAPGTSFGESGSHQKNAFSSAPGITRPAGRTYPKSSLAGACDPSLKTRNNATAPEDEGDKIVTLAGKVPGQTVRIRIRPEVHAYLSTLPVIVRRFDNYTGNPNPSSPPGQAATDRRDSIHSANSSSCSGLTLGSGEGSFGYQEEDYEAVIDEYTLLQKAVDEHDPEALRLLTETEAAYRPYPEGGGSEYPYLKEMKERLLISKEGMEDTQLLEVHQTPVGTVVKLNADGYGSHTSPTHRLESFYTGTLESRKTNIRDFFPKNAKTSTFITLSLLYATLLVVVCLGFVLSEVITHNVPLYYYEAFFTYLYGFSILFLLYVFCYLLSDTTRERKPSNQGSISGQYNVAEYEYFAYNEGVLQKVRKPEVLPTDGSPTQEKLTGPIPKPKKHKTSDNDHSHGSFFLRIGAIAFGLGTMIYNGLEFGIFFEIPMSSPCYQILRGVNPLLQLMFTFMQMYFIFMNARLNIHKFKFLARFGLMHMVATNICVWIRTLVRESLKEINEFRVTQGATGEDYMIMEGIRRALENRGLMAPNRYMYNLQAFTEGNTTLPTGNWVSEEDLVNRTCERMEIMGSIVSDSAPYLYPFIVEYSLIGAAVLYIMWKHIGRNPKFIYDVEAADGVSTLSRRCQAKVDCIGASKGLFCGLLVLVATLICLILFFVLIHQQELRMLAIYLADVSHCGIMFLSIVAIFIGFCRVRLLKFFGEREEELDDILLMVSAFGLFSYAVFSTVAGSLSAFTEEPNLLVMVTGMLSIIQVMIQMVFIKDTQRRQVALPEHERTKPGRQIVTFLLICNLAMFIIYTFETPKVEANPVQLEFFGKLSWTILLRCTLPLAIFHRFHSSVVLAAIWKNSYKTRIE